MYEDEAISEMQTRRRLLDAAGEVFAEKGFVHATIREICKKAEANVAAVNYHFGDKQKLYAAVFEDSSPKVHTQSAEISGASPEDRLRAFIRGFLKHILDPGRSSCHGRLMAHEMAEPTGMLESFIEAEVRPRVAVLQQIVSDLGGDLPPRVIAKLSMSVVGQMLHYRHAQAVIKRISPIYADLDQHVEELVDHITRFSLAGIYAIAERYGKEGP